MKRVMKGISGRRIGDRLVSDGLVKRDDVERAAEAAEAEDRRLSEVLVSWGLVDERALYRHLAAQQDVPFAEAEALLPELDRGVARALSRERQDELAALPIGADEEELRVAVCDPSASLDALARALDCEADRLAPVVVTPTDLRRLQWYVDLGPLAGREQAPEPDSDTDLLHHDLRTESASAAICDALLAEAVAQGASDVHVEPRPGGARLRLRVDGELHDCPHLEVDSDRLRGLVSVIKVRSGLDITERRRPQEGRLSQSIAGRHFDVRIQTQPSLHGESLVLRMLSPDERLLTVDRLGFLPALQVSYLRMLESPSGLVLVAGPSGCGKSTTLYAGLQVLAEDTSRKVITVEDPIEYEIDGVLQTQVDRSHGFDFSRAVRTFVRQDPDVMLVGEIRDAETALEALRASQTGHLVLATIHANDAVDAVQRLFDLGMHPNSIAAELLAVFAQRLALRICPACRAPHEPDRSLVREIFPGGAPEDLRAFRGEGCSHCRGYGAKGRIAVAEYLPSTRALRAAIARHAPLDELREAALRAGLRTMRSEALELVAQGTIAMEELPKLFSVELLLGQDP